MVIGAEIRSPPRSNHQYFTASSKANFKVHVTDASDAIKATFSTSGTIPMIQAHLLFDM